MNYALGEKHRGRYFTKASLSPRRVISGKKSGAFGLPKAKSRRPFNPLLSLFEMNLSKSLERKQEKSNPKLLGNNQLMTSAQRPVIWQRNFLEESLLRANSAKVTKCFTRQAKSKFTPGSLTSIKRPQGKHSVSLETTFQETLPKGYR